MTKKKPGPKRKGGRKPVHGAYALIKKGRNVPAQYRSVARFLGATREGLIEDLGGDERITTAQRVLVDRAICALGVVSLVEKFIRDKGYLIGDRIPAFLLHDLSHRFLSWDRKLEATLVNLGLERKKVHDEPLTIQAIHDLIDAEGSDPEESGSGPVQEMPGNGYLFISGKGSDGDPDEGKGSGILSDLGDPGKGTEIDGIGSMDESDQEREG